MGRYVGAFRTASAVHLAFITACSWPCRVKITDEVKALGRGGATGVRSLEVIIVSIGDFFLRTVGTAAAETLNLLSVVGATKVFQAIGAGASCT